jgi:hypothetical protein
LKDVRIYGQTSSPKAALDARFTDLQIRAAAFPRKQAPAKVENIPVSPATPSDPQQAAPAPKQGSKGYVAALLIGLALTLILVFGLGMWFRARKRGGVAQSVFFACPQCAKAFKAKAEMAGKKVKCAQCAAVVLVPALEAGEARGASS